MLVPVVAACPSDADALRDLHVETWTATYRDRLHESFYHERLAEHRARDWADLLRCQTAAGGGVLIAKCNSDLGGLCQYGPTQDDDDDPRLVGHIHRLYVHPLRHRQGIGRSLLNGAEGSLQRRGMSAVTLWVLEADERARAFYEHLGWEPDGKRRFDGAVDVRYRLTIQSLPD